MMMIRYDDGAYAESVCSEYSVRIYHPHYADID